MVIFSIATALFLLGLVISGWTHWERFVGVSIPISAQAARGELLCFVDADTFAHPTLIASAVRAM